MREYLNADTLFVTVAMLRADTASLILVVEGQDDYFILKPHCCDELSIVMGVGGRPGVLAAAETVERNSLRGVKFLVDSDYDSVVCPTRKYPVDVILSDGHDIFMDLVYLSLTAVDRVIEIHSRRAVRRASEGTAINGPIVAAPEVIRGHAFNLASKVSAFRIVNEREQYGLKLSPFPFGNSSVIEASLDALAELVILQSVTSLTVGVLVDKVHAEMSDSADSHVRLIGDHDFFGALAQVMRSQSIKGISSEVLLSSFISTISCNSIMKASWFSALQSWAETTRKDVLSCPCAA